MRITMHRAKWRMEGCFMEGYLCYTPSTNEVGLQTFETHGIVHVVPETVGEYTGRLDTRGKRIYEGDIVQYGTGLWLWSITPERCALYSETSETTQLCRDMLSLPQ